MRTAQRLHRSGQQATFSHPDGRAVVDDAFAALGLERRVRLALPHLMALPEILRSTDLVAAVPARAVARFGAGLATFDLDFLAHELWTLRVLWSPYARKDRAQAWLRGAISAICAGLCSDAGAVNEHPRSQ